MATITSLGSGSGLELESLVTKLMAAESVSLTTLQAKQTSYETKISAMGSLRSVLSSLQTAASNMVPATLQSTSDKFGTYTATLANTSVATATASSGAVAGSYSLEVSHLAQGQRLTSAAVSSSSSITTNGGTLTLSLGSMNSTTGLYEADASRTYNISLSAGATLSDLRDAINDSDAGVTASIINGTAGSQLVLTGPEGANSIMRLSSSTTVDPDTSVETNDISGFNYDPDVSTSQDMAQSVEALDAEFTLNGIAATSHSNKVSDVLDGVTLELTGTNIGSATTLKITEDFSTKLTESLQAFVTAYNTAYSTMSSLGAYNTETQVAGALQGNSTLRLAMTQIRQNIFGTTSGNASSAYQTLSNIGVSISASGTLSIDTTKLNAAIKADSSTVTDLITNVGNAFDNTIDNLINTDGSVTIATNGLNTTVKDLENQQTKMQDRLDAIEARYRAQFSALDTLVASLTSTGDYLTSFISSLSSN